jgi:hypothetical protein
MLLFHESNQWGGEDNLEEAEQLLHALEGDA